MTNRRAARAQDIIARCQTIAKFSEASDGTTRTFLSEAMRDCHRMLAGWMESLGLEVRVDAVGNLRGLYRCGHSGATRLIVGSHLDTVPNAGAYDGVLGVVLAIALIDALEKRPLPFDIEIIGFSEEEGVRFGVPFIGSRALIGAVDEELLNRRDASGVTVHEAIRKFGLDPSRIEEAACDPRAFAYLEFHIEQGPVLDGLDKPLAVVEAIASQSRLSVVFTGQANHAGTTPMHLRRDALVGAAEWIGIVETEAQSVSGLVATVGHIETKPGAANVIAGEARLSLDVRHASDEARTRAVDRLLHQAREVAEGRGLSSNWSVLLEQSGVEMDLLLTGCARRALQAAGSPLHSMVSGAGHDAMIMARKVPATMIFLRSPEGISHHPRETVRVEDVELALCAGVEFIHQLASPSN